jgi:hypothetical protein
MTKEQLKALGLTDEQVEKVWERFDGKFIPKHRFDEVNDEWKVTKEALRERDEQLEKLKKSTGAVEALKKQITDLQAKNKTKDETHAAEIKRMKREALDERLLIEAGAIDPLAAKPFLAAIDDGADDESYAADQARQIDALTKTESKKFLFKAAGAFTGVKPGETGTPEPAGGALNPFAKDNYDEAEQIKLFRQNPDMARALAKQAGSKFI